MGKKRKADGPVAVVKKKVKQGRTAGSKDKPSRTSHGKTDNVFETLWTRRKFDVLGKKQKGESRRVGLSRSTAVDKRKKTLLQEYKQRGKVNAFLDHRFGEQDENLAEEDKAILRFQKERMAQLNRKSKFALQDDDDDNEAMEVLTHGGSALSTLDDFREDVSMEDEGDDSGLRSHVWLGTECGFYSSMQQRTKKEIMEEVISKSKFYKAQKAKEKEEDHDLMENLDSEFSLLAQSNALQFFLHPDKINALKSLLAKGSTPEGGIEGSFLKAGDKSNEDKVKPDDYDKLMKEMVFELRGHASDRSKSVEELDKEERTRLEELEKNRKQRMHGDSDNDEETSEEDYDKGKILCQNKKRSDISGDHLEENFVMEDEYQEKGWVDEVLARRGEEDNEEVSDNESEDCEDGGEILGDSNYEDSQDDNANTDDGWEQSEDDVVELNGMMSEDISEKTGRGTAKDPTKLSMESEGLKKDRKVLKRESEATFKEGQQLDDLPFVIEAPQTLLEFQKLVDHRSVEDLATAIQRIQKCNAISLAADNRRKMQVFYNVLLQYFASVAGEKSLSTQRLNVMVKPLIELSGETPYFAALCARERIVRSRHQLSEKLRSTGGIICWPSTRTLLLLRLWSLIFPPSDFRHAVMTPAMLLMSEYLLRCPVTSARDVAIGSFICSLLLSVMRPAHRFCPEALNFLHALLLSTVPIANHSEGAQDLTKQCPVGLFNFVVSSPWLRLSTRGSPEVELQPLDILALLVADDSSPIFESDSFRVGILGSVLQTLNGFAGIYKDLMSFPEVFSPFLSVLETIPKENALPEALQSLITHVAGSITQQMIQHEQLRQPLHMRVSKPVPIKQFNPRFEANYVQGRDYDLDRERAEKKKLVWQLKREAKGAVRELRKDNHFLAKEKAKERSLAEEERDKKYCEAMAFLQGQESAFKSGQLGKGRKKRKQ
ncbi:unnamed protein product [Sphagnum compactum]